MAAKARTAAQRSWRERSAASSETPEIRRTKRWLMTAIVLGMVAAFVWLVVPLFRTIPQVRLACLRVINYDKLAVPLVPFADENAASFTKLLGDNATTLKALETTATFESLGSQLATFASQPTHHLVVYVNAHGVASGDDADLLGSDYLRRVGDDKSSAPSTAGRITIDDLVKQVTAAPAAEKLIILDCGYLPCDARSGVIGNEFATAVARRVAASKDRHLWVLLSNSVHEISQPAYKNRRSLLADSIVQAVQGAADSNEDGVVELFELAGFVCQRVPQQAKASGLRLQTPVLLWGGGSENLPTSERLFPLHVVEAETAPTKEKPQDKPDAEKKSPEKVAADATPRATPLLGALSTSPVLVAQAQPATNTQQPTPAAGQPTEAGAQTPPTADAGKQPAASGGASGAQKPATTEQPPSAEKPGGDAAAAPTGDAVTPAGNPATTTPAQPPAAAAPKQSEKPKPVEKPTPLQQLWLVRDQMLERTAERPFNPIDYAPLAWREYEELLLSFERQYRFGGPQVRKEIEAQIAKLNSYSESTKLSDLSSTGPLGDVLPRLTVARQQFVGSPAQRGLMLDNPRAAGLRQAVQARNDALYLARDLVRWHAAATLGSGKPHALFDPIRQFLDFTGELNERVLEELSRDESAQDDASLTQQIERLVELRRMIQSSLLALANDSRITPAQIEELLSTPALTGKTRASLIELLDKRSGAAIPAVTTTNIANLNLAVTESSDAWQRAAEQAELEIKLAALAGETAASTITKRIDSKPKEKCRQIGSSLEAFYRSLPGRVKQLEPADANVIAAADQLLRLVDARDAAGVGSDANIVSQVAWLPMPKGELSINPLPSSLELNAKNWKPLPLAIRATSDFEKRISLAIDYKPDELEVRSADQTIDVTPGASSELRLNRDLRRELTLEIRPRSAQAGSYQLAVIFSADDRPVHRAELECIATLELPNRVDLAITRDSVDTSDPYVVSVNHDRWRLRPYPNRHTAYQVALANQSGKAKKVNVELFSIARPQPGAKLINERGGVFSTLRPKRLAATAQPVDLAPSATPVPLALASTQAPTPPVDKPKEGEPPPVPPKPPAPVIEGALLYVVHEVGGDALHWPQLVELAPLAPDDYLLPKVSYEKGTISVEIRSPSPELMPPLSPEQPMLIDWVFDDPNLAKRDPSGRFSDALPDGTATSTLTAVVGADHEEKVRMYLHVDGYPRAFIYEVPCTADPVDNVDPWRAARVTITRPQNGSVGKPASVLKALFQVDAPDAFKQIEDELVVGLDLGPGGRGSDRRWTDADPPRLRFYADRQTRLTLEEVGAGTIKVGVDIDDYELDLASLGIKNQRFDVVGQLVLPRPDSPPDGIAEEARVTVVIDEQPPVIEQIAVEPRRTVEVGKPLTIRVETNDGELSGVSKVLWALDDKEPNGVLDPAEKEAPKLLRYLPERGLWIAVLDTKADIPKPDPVGNRIFIWSVDKAENVGEPELVEFRITAPMEPSTKAAAKKGTIKGKVALEESGGSPKFSLVTVRLKEDKPIGGKVVASAKADTEGNFIFKNVAMGSYVVEAEGPVIGSNKVGQAAVVLAPNPDDPAKPPVEVVDVLVGRPKPPMTPPAKPM